MSAEAIEHAQRIQTDGYTVLKEQFTQAQAQAAIAEFDDYFASLPEEIRRLNTKPDGFPNRLSNFHGVSDAVQRLYAATQLYHDVAFYFFGCRRAAISTSLFFANGTEQSIHRDSPAFCTIPEGEYLGVWFALEKATEQNGALRVVAGGQKFTEKEYLIRQQIIEQFPDMPHGELWSKYQANVHREIAEKELSISTVEAEVGDIIIWHPHLPHGGGPIRDKTLSRYSCVFHVAPEGTEIYDHDAFWRPMQGTNSKKPQYIDIQNTGQLMRKVIPAFQK